MMLDRDGREDAVHVDRVRIAKYRGAWPVHRRDKQFRVGAGLGPSASETAEPEGESVEEAGSRWRRIDTRSNG